MEDKNKLPKEENKEEKTVAPTGNDTIRAHREADKDIAKDADLNAQSKNDDLDEGERARLGEDTSASI